MSFFEPQRPENPDYEQLQRIVKDFDRARKEGRTVPEIVGSVVDLYSAQYLAEQRAQLVCAQLGIHSRMAPYLAATFLNAFTIGVIFERERSREREWERARDRDR